MAMLLAFLSSIYYVKVLSSSGYGNIATIQAIMVYITLIVLYGLQTYGTREISKNKDSINLIAGNIILFRIIVLLISYVAIFLVAFIFVSEYEFKWLIIFYALTLLPAAINLDWVFIGMQKMHYNAVYNIIRNLLPFVLSVIFIKKNSGIYLIPVFVFVGLALGLIYQLFVFYKKEKLKLKPVLKIETIHKYLLLGGPFLFSGILATINLNSDRLVISFTISKTAAAIYAVAYLIISFLMNVVVMIFTPVVPSFIALFHNNKLRELSILADKVAKIIILAVFPLVVGGILLSKDIISLFKKEYATASTPFAILLIYILILFMRELYGYGLNAWNMEKEYLKIVIISSIVNLVGNLLFTPTYGMNAAAIITVFSEVINFVLMKKQGQKIIRVSYKTYVVKIMPSIFLMILFVALLKYNNINVIINIIVAMIVYIIAVFMTKYVTLKEIRGFLQLKSR